MTDLPKTHFVQFKLYSFNSYNALSEDRTHDFEIMRLARCPTAPSRLAYEEIVTDKNERNKWETPTFNQN